LIIPQEFFYITLRGFDVLKEILEKIDMRNLMKFSEFQEFLKDGQFNKEKENSEDIAEQLFP